MRRILFCTAALCALLALWPSANALARADGKKAIWGPVTRNGVSQFPIYQDLGAKIYEIGLPWAAVAPNRPADPTNPNDPAYQWPAELDQAVAGAASAGMRVSIELTTAPGWANGGNSTQRGHDHFFRRNGPQLRQLLRRPPRDLCARPDLRWIQFVYEPRQQKHQRASNRQEPNKPSGPRDFHARGFLTSSSAKRFGASAVTNIELVTQVAANATHIR